MTTGMTWCPVSNMVIITKQSNLWRGMMSRKSRSFSQREFLVAQSQQKQLVAFLRGSKNSSLFISNVNEVIRVVFIIFLRETISHAQKHETLTSKQKQKRQRFMRLKNILRGRKSIIRLFAFLRILCLLCFLCLLCLLCFLCFLRLQNLFVKKIK